MATKHTTVELLLSHPFTWCLLEPNTKLDKQELNNKSNPANLIETFLPSILNYSSSSENSDRTSQMKTLRFTDKITYSQSHN